MLENEWLFRVLSLLREVTNRVEHIGNLSPLFSSLPSQSTSSLRSGMTAARVSLQACLSSLRRVCSKSVSMIALLKEPAGPLALPPSRHCHRSTE
jgi:hypothetical protein